MRRNERRSPFRQPSRYQAAPQRRVFLLRFRHGRRQRRKAAPQMKGYFFLPAFHLKTIFIPLFLFFIISSLSFWPTSNSLRYNRRLERETERRDDFQTAGVSNARARVCVCVRVNSAQCQSGSNRLGGPGAAFSQDAPVLQSVASV